MLSNNVFKRIKNIGKNRNSIEFETITLGELLTKDFINRCTDFSDFDHMISISGFKTMNNSFADIFISEEWDEFVNRTTEFKGWNEMIKEAVLSYILS